LQPTEGRGIPNEVLFGGETDVDTQKPKKERDLNNHKLSEDLQNCLKYLVNKYEKEDGWVRKQQIKLWKKNEEFWHGIQFIFWSETKQDWMAPIGTSGLRWFAETEGREGAEGPFYDFVVNIFKAHGEAIIAALSSQIPAVRFPPDNAEDADDVQTSRTYAKIADLIGRHNQVKLLQLASLFVLWNQGLIAWYHAPKADRAFGVVNIETYKKQLSCPNCDETHPVDDEEDLLEGLHNCPNCGSPLEIRTVLDGIQESPKTRVIIDTFGGLHVKVPYWARKQGDCSYLIKAIDQPKPFLKSIYEHIADKIENDEGDSYEYERMARTPSSYTAYSRSDDNRDLGTHKQVWLRPWAFEGLPAEKEKEKKALYRKFPNGCYVAFVGNTYAESRDEDMDKHWTLAKCSLSSYIHSDALGQPLISIQELRNVLVNITQETIEQGVGSGFADSSVLNFDVYSKHEARPGMMYAVHPKPGQALGDSFFEFGRATLSKEVGAFFNQLDQDAQFSVGSFPSIYGGPAEGKSRTLGEYQQSRQQALQRLQITWQLFCIYWAKLMEKCVHMYVENMIDDERFVQPDPTNKDNYVNVWIRKGEMTGHVGEVEPEGADQFPMSITQKQAIFFKLLEYQNEGINSVLFDPSNRRYVADLTGFTELVIPGEDQRIKQCVEIDEILKGIPIQVEPLVDDHAVHMMALKEYMNGPQGMDLKMKNPQGYAMLTQHLQEHQQAAMQLAQQATQQQMQQATAAYAQRESIRNQAKAQAEMQRDTNKERMKAAHDIVKKQAETHEHIKEDLASSIINPPQPKIPQNGGPPKND
jgi:Zn finger protein HypA/HybF involved in hydrogenase expression